VTRYSIYATDKHTFTVKEESGAVNYFIRGPRTISTAPKISNAPAATGGTLAVSGLSTVAVTGPILATSSRLW
jgi:hypothetical protein